MPLLLAVFAGFAGIALCARARTRFRLADSTSKTRTKVVARALVDYLDRMSLWAVIVYLPLVLLTSGSTITGDALGWLQAAALSLKAVVEQWSHVLSDFVLGWLVAAAGLTIMAPKFVKKDVQARVGAAPVNALLSQSAFDTIKRAGSFVSAASLALLLITLLDLPDDSIASTTVSTQAISANDIRVNFVDHEIARTMAVQVIRSLALTHRVSYPLADTVDAIGGDWRDPNSLALTDRFVGTLQNIARAKPRLVMAVRTKWERYCSGFSSPLGGNVYGDEAIDRAVDFLFSLAPLPKGQLPSRYREAISGATSALLKLERDDVESTFADIARAKDPQDLDRRLRADVVELARHEQREDEPLLALMQDGHLDTFLATRITRNQREVEDEMAREDARDGAEKVDIAP